MHQLCSILTFGVQFPLNLSPISITNLKPALGSPDQTGPDRSTPEKFWSQGRILLNLGGESNPDLGNWFGHERGSFLSVRVLFYGPGLNFGSSKMTLIDIHQQIKEMMTIIKDKH